MHTRPLLCALAILFATCRQADMPFRELPSDKTGIDFNNYLEETDELNVLNYTYFYNGGGVATGDLNNDGLVDIVFTGNMVRNKIFINKGGMRFEDVTTSSHIADKQGWCTGVTLVDINSDGWLDIYICRSADTDPARRSNLLFINNKDLTFTEQAAAYGLDDKGYSTQSAFFDYDRDGDLDAVIINHSLKKYTTGVSDNPGLRNEENPFYGSRLYRNDDGVFTDVSKAAGVTSNVLSFGLGVVVSDFDGDGWPDFFISNDFNEPDYLFINRRDGTFSEEGSVRLAQHSLYSMGTDAADIDQDGRPDLVTLDMLPEGNYDQKMHSGAENFEKFRYLFSRGFHNQYSRNMLHVNNGDGSFSEVGQLAGISNTDWSWAALLKDFDNDMRNDLFVTNGYVRDYTDMDFIKYSFDRQVAMQESGGSDESVMDYIRRMPSHPLSNYMFRNEGGYRFRNVSRDWGFSRTAVYSGVSSADLDGDGDLDLVASVTNGTAGVFENRTTGSNGNGYLRFSFTGKGRNTMGLGAVVRVYCGDTVQMQEHHLTRGFQSSMEPVMHFGMGRRGKADSVRVTWPDGSVQVIPDVPAGTVRRLAQADARPMPPPARQATGPLLEETTADGLETPERYQGDFSIQQSLNNFMGNVSPVMAVADLDRDGKEDLVVGATRMRQTRLFFSNGVGFSRTDSLSGGMAAPVSAILPGDFNGDGSPDLLIGYNVFGAAAVASTVQLLQNDGRGRFKPFESGMPAFVNSIGCLAIDRDSDAGMTRIFIGTRIRGADYPFSDPGRVVVLDASGRYVATEQTDSAVHGRMLTGAAFIDIDLDGTRELVTAGEFEPVSVHKREGNLWADVSSKVGGLPGSGWWTAMRAEDLDGDGDEDIVLGNYGLNTQFSASRQAPVAVLGKDFDGNGKTDAVTSYFIGGTSYPSHSLDDLLEQMPSLRKRFNTYAAYAKTDMGGLFTESDRKGALERSAVEMRTLVLENKGNAGFSVQGLPVQAQFAPVFAIAVSDVDGDGRKDLLLCGNQSGTRIKYGKYDANTGFVFKGVGGMRFRHMPSATSGVFVRGDVRSAVFLDGGRRLLIGVHDASVRSFQKRRLP